MGYQGTVVNLRHWGCREFLVGFDLQVWSRFSRPWGPAGADMEQI